MADAADPLDTGPERQSGRKAQTANIVAAKVSKLDAPHRRGSHGERLTFVS